MPPFSNLLTQRVGEVVAPPMLPVGTWDAHIVGRKFDKSARKKTDFVQFEFELDAPGADVDSTELAEVKWQGRKLTDDFYITEAALKRLEEFVALCGVPEGMTLEEGIQHLYKENARVKLSVIHEPYEDKQGQTRFAVRIGGYAQA